MCTCQIVPGGTILCDDCASDKIAAINDLLGQEYAELPITLTPSEVEGLTSVANSWLSSLAPESQQQGATS
jgi:hypothetical protein